MVPLTLSEVLNEGRETMASAILSILLAVISFFVLLPVLVPVIGFALGGNGLVRELKLENPRALVKAMSIVGMVLCGISITLFFLVRFQIINP